MLNKLKVMKNPTFSYTCNDCQYSTFSYPKIEKLNSTVTMFTKVEESPLQNSIKMLNHLDTNA
jgi:hypothetical protein